ncbi:type IV pilin protein [Delftia acidovorans]|uniref:type IV pilin protein n=1 Tax=Delftia acidovorans TaxID=80866 RepID=UPI0022B565B0|nr:type IV pilin protein [Delftia acidovorans]
MSGFTLIEILIVIAMMAILMAIALPSYSDYLKRGRIVDGLVPLADMGAKLEQYFQDHRTYTGACSTDSIAPLPAETSHFEYTCALTETPPKVTASGKGSMSGFVFTLDTQGVRKTAETPAGWTKPTANCWSSRKDGSC